MSKDVAATRSDKTALYLRICKDSGYRMPFERAAALAGKMLRTSALDIWLAFSSIETMQAVAAGTHPACRISTAEGATP